VADQDLPPVYIQFKADIEQLMSSLKQIEAGLGGFQTTADNAGTSAQALGAKTVAAGILMANVLSNIYAKVKAFGSETVHAFGEVAGEVGKMRKVLGGSAEDMSQLRFAAEETGVDSGKLIIALRTLSRHLTTNDAAIQSLGISYRDANGKLKPTKEVLAAVADRFAAMPNGLEKTALATKLFGRAGIDMISTLNLGSKGLKEMYIEADKLGLQLSGDDLDSNKAYTMSQREMHAAIQGVQVTIGRELVPMLTRMVQFINSSVLPKIKEFIDGFIGSKSITKGMNDAGSAAYNWGEKLRHMVGIVVAFRDQIVITAIAMAGLWITSKIVAGATALMTLIGAVKKAYLALRASAAAAWVMEMFALNPIAGVAALTLGLIAITGAIDLFLKKLDNYDFALPDIKLPKGLGDMKDFSPLDVADPNAAKNKTKTFFETLLEQRAQLQARFKLKKLGASNDFITALLGSENWQQEANNLIAGGKNAVNRMMRVWRQTEAGRKELFDARYNAEMKKLTSIQDKIQAIDSNAALSMETMANRSFRERFADINFYVKQAAALVKAAKVEEVKTRGTKAHADAVRTLNNAVAEQAKLQAQANQLAVDNAKSVAEQNRQQALLNNTMSASNSFLAAQVRTSGVSAAQAGSFIEVPVIIDGQTVFRVVQKHSLLNDRRNVANGLSKSGSTIG